MGFWIGFFPDLNFQFQDSLLQKSPSLCAFLYRYECTEVQTMVVVNIGMHYTKEYDVVHTFCIPVVCILVSTVEGNLVVNKCELQYYDYSIAVMSALLLKLMHVFNLVVAPVWFVCHMFGIPYADINTPSTADSGRIVGGGERGAAAEAKQAF